MSMQHDPRLEQDCSFGNTTTLRGGPQTAQEKTQHHHKLTEPIMHQINNVIDTAHYEDEKGLWQN